MKKKSFPYLIITFVLFSYSMQAASAAVKSGTACQKLGQIAVSNQIKYTCVLSKNKLVWNKGIKVAPSSKEMNVSPSPSPIISNSSTPSPKVTISAKPNPFEAELTKALENKAQEESKLSEISKLEKSKYAQLSKTKCGVISPCEVGNTGPGGGIVFFVSEKKQNWGQYLEMAPFNWFSIGNKKLSGVQISSLGDPSSIWCDKTEFHLFGALTNPDLKKSVGIEIGKGKSNTELMLAGCKYGAAHLATSYSGGGLNDWFLPSINELNEMCKFASGIKTGTELLYLGGTSSNSSTCGTREMPSKFTLLGDFFRGSESKYWSSSENSNNRAWCQRFDDVWTSNWEKSNFFFVRPIRAF